MTSSKDGPTAGASSSRPAPLDGAQTIAAAARFVEPRLVGIPLAGSQCPFLLGEGNQSSRRTHSGLGIEILHTLGPTKQAAEKGPDQNRRFVVSTGEARNQEALPVRGRQDAQVSMLTFIDADTRVPPNHPLRKPVLAPSSS